ncbi:hypothetical protein HYALB_00013366 [Hymenoscyphus albidus]|uniref:N-acetyltransferase domain-containing protein n=1 Tax=Hymenoscyphus albidus TaxID=595503 RepID=A0A9N9LWS7_9HELO|nr:hypothetical protein HYALB_00013366 [Hymenoscyphus albidus]
MSASTSDLFDSAYQIPQNASRARINMSFQLSEVKREAEFKDLVKTEYLAYQKPYNAFWEVLKGPNVEECTQRQWWPLKSVSNHMLYTFFSGRPSVMNRPHLHYRRRGVGRLMMEWGCKLADEMGLQCFVESTDDGRELYKSAGFVAVHPFFLDAQPSNEQEGDNPEWLKVKDKITPEPYRVWLMWRPEGGIFKDGKIGFPWEG